MTDEEKAEKYVKENCCEFCVNKYDCEMGWIDCHTKEGVLYGLAEGRKEKCLEQNNDGTIRPCEVMKENEQLKERIREAENDSNNCEHWSYTRIKQLEEQIEKMKTAIINFSIANSIDEKYNSYQKLLELAK